MTRSEGSEDQQCEPSSSSNSESGLSSRTARRMLSLGHGADALKVCRCQVRSSAAHAPSGCFVFDVQASAGCDPGALEVVAVAVGGPSSTDVRGSGRSLRQADLEREKNLCFAGSLSRGHLPLDRRKPSAPDPECRAHMSRSREGLVRAGGVTSFRPL